MNLIFLLVIVTLVFIFLTLNNRNTESFENLIKPPDYKQYVRKFVNFKLDEFGNLLGTTLNNPNSEDKTKFCINSFCPERLAAIDSICWVCIDKNKVNDDFQRVPSFKDTLKDYYILM